MISSPKLEMSEPVKKGIAKSFGVGRKAPPELQVAPTPAQQAHNIRSTGVVGLFAGKKRKNANKKNTNKAVKVVAAAAAPAAAAPAPAAAEAPTEAPTEAPAEVPAGASDSRKNIPQILHRTSPIIPWKD